MQFLQFWLCCYTGIVLLACFTQTLVQNFMNLVLCLKVRERGQKMLKTKIVWNNTYMRVSEVKG